MEVIFRVLSKIGSGTRNDIREEVENNYNNNWKSVSRSLQKNIYNVWKNDNGIYSLNLENDKKKEVKAISKRRKTKPPHQIPQKVQGN